MSLILVAAIEALLSLSELFVVHTVAVVFVAAEYLNDAAVVSLFPCFVVPIAAEDVGAFDKYLMVGFEWDILAQPIVVQQPHLPVVVAWELHQLVGNLA